jgi:hypothetical protein
MFLNLYEVMGDWWEEFRIEFRHVGIEGIATMNGVT